MLSEESNWSHWICLPDSAYIAYVIALSIALYLDSGDVAEKINKCLIVYDKYYIIYT